MKYTCEICNTKINQDDLYADDSGDYHQDCIDKYHYESAILAGIPKSVVDGHTNLSDHFSKEYINFKCNKKD